MIQANELRIGNWVMLPNGSLVQMDRGFFQFNKDFCNIEDFNPIILTPEILDKCVGFYQLPHFTVGNNWLFNLLSRNRVLSIACVGTPNEKIFLSEEDGKQVNQLIVLRNYDYDGKTYLHILQNIVHALTGEELIYKP